MKPKLKLKGDIKQKIAVGVVCLLIVSYTVYHVASIFGEDVSTYAAGITTENTVFSFTGYVFRDEKVLTSSNDGATEYHVPDGTKVAEGQKVATVYEDNGSMQSYISWMDKYISVLEQSTGDALLNVDIVKQRENNADAYDAVIKLLANNDTTGLDYNIQKLLVGVNVEEGLIGSNTSSADKLLEKLKNERDELFATSGSSESCSVSETGYFFSEVDGCEDDFTIDAAKNITVSDFEELRETAADASGAADAYGKLSDSSEWMIVLPTTRKDSKNFKVGNTYSALFAENNRTEMPMLLENIVTEDDSSTVLLVFSCDRQPKNFTFDRTQSVTLTVNTVSGIYIPKNIVVREDGMKGVYILRGSVVHFRYIEVLYEGSDYYLVSANSENEENMYYIRENDMIILTGQNLFDGRVLD